MKRKLSDEQKFDEKDGMRKWFCEDDIPEWVTDSMKPGDSIEDHPKCIKYYIDEDDTYYLFSIIR